MRNCCDHENTSVEISTDLHVLGPPTNWKKVVSGMLVVRLFVYVCMDG
jgi:hypothetical protein